MHFTQDDHIRISLSGTSERGRTRLKGIVAMASSSASSHADPDGHEASRASGPRIVDEEFYVPVEDASAVYSTLSNTDDVCLLAIANRLQDELRLRIPAQ